MNPRKLENLATSAACAMLDGKWSQAILLARQPEGVSLTDWEEAVRKETQYLPEFRFKQTPKREAELAALAVEEEAAIKAEEEAEKLVHDLNDHDYDTPVAPSRKPLRLRKKAEVADRFDGKLAGEYLYGDPGLW